MYSVGVSPTMVKARNPIAWVARSRETKTLKPTNNTILWMVSKSLGHSESERIERFGLERIELPGSRACDWGGEGSMGS